MEGIWPEVLIGDCRMLLDQLEPESVHAVITSPPYWNLRDYNCAGQIGLEPTFAEHLDVMVDVCRKIRRVLRRDGIMWLNLGDAMVCKKAGRSAADTKAAGKDNRTFRDKPFSTGRNGSGGQRDRSHDTSGRVSQDSRERDSSLIHLCDGCQSALSSRTEHTDSHLALLSGVGCPDQSQAHIPSSAPCPDSEDSSRLTASQPSPLVQPDHHNGQSLPGVLLPGVPASTRQQFSPPLPGECWHCDNCGVCLSVLRSGSRDGRLCARREVCIDGTAVPWGTSVPGRLGTAFSFAAYPNYTINSLKEKDMMGMPWRIAFALQSDGWYLRSAITWVKPGPMPESAVYRPTQATEMVFMFTKQPRYFYDQEAVRPLAKTLNLGRSGNLLNWWMIASQPLGESHYATFPEALVEPCILAGTSERGCCPACGSPWKRTTEDTPEYATLKKSRDWKRGRGETLLTGHEMSKTSDHSASRSVVTTGWQPTCFHDLDPEPCVILDPFAGSGTTLRVATNLGRKSIGIDLSGEYLKIIKKRTAQGGLGI